MTPEQLDLVESSLAAVAPRMEDLVEAFYERLFELEPATRRLFGDDLTAQRHKFAAELAFVVTGLRHRPGLVTAAESLGRHHGDLGVRPEHFRLAGFALVDALAVTLGDSWTPELGQAWRLAYRLTAEAMMTGASCRLRR